MADATYNIHVAADGGDAAAGEIAKASSSLNNVTSSSSALQEKFQERFQHIGLQLFAGQALGSIGLSGEVRSAVMLMNTAITGAQEAAGIASGGLVLLVTALAAVGEAVYHVIEHQTNLIDSLNNTHEAQAKQLQSTDDNVTALEAYADAGGNMTTALSNMLSASQALRAAQIQEQLATDLQTISIMKDTVAKEENSIATTKSISMDDLKYLANVRTSQAATEGAAIMKRLSDATASNTLELEKNKAKLAETEIEYDNLKNGVVTNIAAMSKAEVAHHDAIIKAAQDEMEATRKLEAEREKDIQKLDATFSKTMTEMSTKENAYNAGAENQSMISTQKKIDNIHIWQDQQELALQNAYFKEVELIQSSVEDEALKAQQLGALTRQYTDAEVALNADAKAKISAADQTYYQAAKQVTDQLATDVGKSFAQMIVEGKNLGDSLKQMFTQMAEQFIEKVITMAIEWAILQAVMDIWPGGAAAYQGVANAAYPAVAQGAYSSIGNGGAQADGGTYMVSSPTMFLAGEAGPEIATFTPMSDLNTPSGGSSGTSGRGASTPSSSVTSGASGTITMGDINVSLQLASLGTSDVNGMLQKLATAIRTASADAIRFAVTSANLAEKNSNVAV